MMTTKDKVAWMLLVVVLVVTALLVGLSKAALITILWVTCGFILETYEQ